MFLYLNLVGAVKVAKEQVYGRQRKLNEKGETFDQSFSGQNFEVCVISVKYVSARNLT